MKAALLVDSNCFAQRKQWWTSQKQFKGGTMFITYTILKDNNNNDMKIACMAKVQ
jgi:hypothetical protein